jgi:hypothetical protein
MRSAQFININIKRLRSNMSAPRIILASSSPRRKELLSQAGVQFSIVVSGCDETPIAGEGVQAIGGG